MLKQSNQLLIQWLALVLVAFAIYLPIMHEMLQFERSDYARHIQWAGEIQASGVIDLPHFLFHLQVVAVNEVAPQLSLVDSALVVTLLAQVFLAAILYRLYNTVSASFALTLFAVVSVLLVAPISITGWAERDVYLGFIGINTYHNPTTNAVKPWVVLSFLAGAAVFGKSFIRPHAAEVAVAATTMVVMTLIKPSFTIALLPGLGLYVLYRLFKQAYINWWLLIVGIGLPAVLTLAVQFLMEYGEGSGQLAFGAFTVMRHYAPLESLPFRFLMSIAFPLAVTGLHWRAARESLYLKLAWLTFGVGAFYTYFLFEDNERIYHGNFGWSGQLSLVVLFVASVYFMLRQYANRDWRALPAKVWFILLVYALHLVSGVFWYYLNYVD
jgi:hypothetical protein